MHKLAITCALAVCLLATAQASAQEETSPPPINPDLPGFLDSASTIAARDVQAELGVNASKPPAETLRATMSLNTRLGLFEGFEGRLRVPAFELRFMRDPSSLQVRMDSMEAGFKASFRFGERITLGLIPLLIFPSGTETSPLAGPGFSGALVIDVKLIEGLNLSAGYTERWVNLTTGVNTRELFAERTGGLYLAGQLNPRVGLYGGAYAIHTTLTRETLIAGELGLTYLITPNLMANLAAGVERVPGRARPVGQLGVSYRY